MRLPRHWTNVIPRKAVYAVIAMLLGGQGYQAHVERTPIGEDVSGVVASIIDGDTLRLNGIKIRLWGVDAPEMDQHGYHQAAGVLSRESLFRMVTCRVRSHDPYGRLVTQCTRQNDGADIGKLVITSGWARDYTRYSRGHYRDVERRARDLRQGLWSTSKAD